MSTSIISVLDQSEHGAPSATIAEVGNNIEPMHDGTDFGDGIITLYPQSMPILGPRSAANLALQVRVPFRAAIPTARSENSSDGHVKMTISDLN